ncbi:MAG: hypothetical protein KJP02_02260 [Octadecabacter sp.]|nr:hypothetical protein [Octadecabacter sp.]
MPDSKFGRWGLFGTVAYLVLIVCLVIGFWDSFKSLEPNAWGDFLAGTFGPLALGWLVLGFFQQGDELRNSVRTLELQAEELRNSVEQQKAMVVVTEKQLDLDIQVRRDQTAAEISKTLPFFQIRGTGSGGAGDGSRRHKFTLTNIGADASEVSVVMNDVDGFHFSPQFLQFTEARKQIELQVIAKQGASLNDAKGLKLKLTCSNIRGQKRQQIFEIVDGVPKLIQTDPENR